MTTKNPIEYTAKGFPNNSGIMIIVRATSVTEARKLASDTYYGVPGDVHPATDDEVAWYHAMTSPIPAKPRLTRDDVIAGLRVIAAAVDPDAVPSGTYPDNVDALMKRAIELLGRGPMTHPDDPFTHPGPRAANEPARFVSEGYELAITRLDREAHDAERLADEYLAESKKHPVLTHLHEQAMRSHIDAATRAYGYRLAVRTLRSQRPAKPSVRRDAPIPVKHFEPDWGTSA